LVATESINPVENMARSNFQFLEEEYALLYNLAQAAEYNLYRDPATSLFKLRQYGEYMYNGNQTA